MNLPSLLQRLIFPTLTLVGSSLAQAGTLPLLPLPAQWQSHGGEFMLDAGTAIVVPAKDPGALQSAHYLADALARSRGITLAIRNHGPGIVLSHAAHCQGSPEAYTLDIDNHGVQIRGCGEAGLFYGVVSLWQLATPASGTGPVALAGVHIADQPRFGWRGLMLDSVRHFQSVDEIERLLDQMARHKLNVFHWHLSDDQGWRLQIKRYPELTRIGAWRTPPTSNGTPASTRYGGFYTQAQVRQVVAYAAARHITVVPELDLPGHAQAAIASYPSLGVTGKRPAVGVDWGINPWLYRPDAKGLHFIENVLDEVMALFPSTYIHVGGDEAIKDQWKDSPAVQAQMHKLGITSEDALQGWMISQLGNYLARHGRRLIGWDEILQGGVPASASVMSWRGIQGALDAAKLGHDTVLAPAPFLYMDNLQSHRNDEPGGRLAVQTLADVYGFDPTKGMDAAQAKHLLGVEMTLWTEYMTSDWHVEHAIFPRLDALAEVAWSPAHARHWEDFLDRLPAQLARYRTAGIAYADSAYAVDFQPQAIAPAPQTRLTLGNQVDRGEIRYTLDGSTPGPQSNRYTSPLTVRDGQTVRAGVFTASGFPLAAARRYTWSTDAPLHVANNQLKPCPGGDLGLRLPLSADGTAHGPAFDTDLFHACWMTPALATDGVHGIEVQAARLARNFGLAHDQAKVVSYPARTPGGELEVYQDSCTGPRLASITLPATRAPARFPLTATIAPSAGRHALCLRFTAPIHGPLYVVGSATLTTAAHPTASVSGSTQP